MRRRLSLFVMLLVSLLTTTSFAQNELTRVPVFTMGESGSRYYRIPAIVETANGTLVAVADQRGSGLGDLPNIISIVAKTSTDKGATWNNMVTIAQGNSSAGTTYGDAAVVYDETTNKVIAIFVGNENYGGSCVGLWASNSSYPLRLYKSESTDNGASWTSPVDISESIYNGIYGSRGSWIGMFAGSGSAVQLKKGAKAGRLMFVVAARSDSSWGGAMKNYAVYSDDNGATWQVSSNAACTSGDEAKIVELENGDLLMSIKNRKDDSVNGSGYRLMAKSTDQGVTWETAQVNNNLMDPACNGDVVSYETTDGKYYLLHSMPASTSTRENVTVYLSLDGGESWPVKRQVYSGYSAYSTLEVLNDGTIGIIVEEGKWDSSLPGTDGFNLAYYNFTLDWLMAEANTEALDLIETANSLLALNGIGYPSTIAKAALREAKEAVEDNASTENVAALTTAINTYYTTSDIERPQAGKTYTFISRGVNADFYLYNGDGTLSLASYSEGAELPDEAKFVCEIDTETGKYMFKTFDGAYYMAYPTIGGKSWLDNESETGLESSVSRVTKFDIEKISIDANVTVTAEDLLGYVHLWGYRGYDNGKYVDMEGPIIVKSSAGTFDGAAGDFYNSNFSSAFQIKPVSSGTPIVLDRSTWDIYTVSSEYAGLDGDNYVTGDKAIDDDPSTYWHSDWDNAANKTVPQWIVFNIGSVQNITAFSYSARTAEARAANGAIKEYKLYVSETAPSLDNLTGTMTEVISGEFTYPNSTHYVDLGGEYSAQYVMLYATSTYGGTEPQDNQFANCAEFTLTGISSGPAPTTYTVNVSANIAAAGTPTINGAEGSAEIVENANATISTTVNAGYEFVNWTYTNGQVVSTEQSFRTKITGTVEFVANFNKLLVETNYCTVSGNISEGRHLASFQISNGNETLDVQGTTNGGAVYVNRSQSSILETKPGTVITFPEFGWTGEWMHAYAYIDYNGDYEFNTDSNNDGTTGGELVTFNCYNKRDINGNSVSNQYACTTTFTNEFGTSKGLPAFKLPTNLERGDYRLRISVAWDTKSPCGYDAIKPNGGILLDMTLRIVGDQYVVTVASSDDEMGSAYIGTEDTTSKKVDADGTQTLELTAVANEYYRFVNWTLGGEVVSTDAVYTTSAITENRDYVANFTMQAIDPRTVAVATNNNQKGYAVFVSPTPEGTATDVTTGEAVTVQAICQTENDFFVNWTINGEVVGTETTYVYMGAEDATIQANFTSKYYVNLTSSENGTVSMSTSEGVVESGTRLEEGTVLTISATASNGYAVASFTINGENLITESSNTVFTYDLTIEGEASIDAVFEEMQCTLTYEYSGAGYIEVWTGDNSEDDDYIEGSPEPRGTKYTMGSSIPYNSAAYIFVFTYNGGELQSILINDVEYINDPDFIDYGDILIAPQTPVHIQAIFSGESSGIEGADVESASVYASEETIYVNGYNGAVQIVNIGGQLVKEFASDGNSQVKMSQGIYFVVTGSQVSKVVVK